MSGDPKEARPRPPEQMAIGLIRDAEAYRAAATRVCPAREPIFAQDANLLAPAWHLLCHASELALKAHLLSTGVDQSSKKGGLMHSSIRHHLNGLFVWAVERGFRPPSQEFADLIEFLDPYHSAHVFRYREQGRVPFIPPSAIADILEPVIAAISQTVREKWQATQSAGRSVEDLANVGLARALPDAADDELDLDHTLRSEP